MCSRMFNKAIINYIYDFMISKIKYFEVCNMRMKLLIAANEYEIWRFWRITGIKQCLTYNVKNTCYKQRVTNQSIVHILDRKTYQSNKSSYKLANCKLTIFNCAMTTLHLYDYSENHSQVNVCPAYGNMSLNLSLQRFSVKSKAHLQQSNNDHYSCYTCNVQHLPVEKS